MAQELFRLLGVGGGRTCHSNSSTIEHKDQGVHFPAALGASRSVIPLASVPYDSNGVFKAVSLFPSLTSSLTVSSHLLLFSLPLPVFHSLPPTPFPSVLLRVSLFPFLISYLLSLLPSLSFLTVFPFYLSLAFILTILVISLPLPSYPTLPLALVPIHLLLPLFPSLPFPSLKLTFT